GYNGGGGGYVLSRAAVKLFLDRAFYNRKICPFDNNEDVGMGRCLQNLEIFPYDTRNEKGQHRFHTYRPDVQFNGAIANEWHFYPQKTREHSAVMVMVMMGEVMSEIMNLMAELVKEAVVMVMMVTVVVVVMAVSDDYRWRSINVRSRRNIGRSRWIRWVATIRIVLVAVVGHCREVVTLTTEDAVVLFKSNLTTLIGVADVINV
ncbi:unnamed protein product, partial [Nippostrongylus brasiliensis]|uniref:Glycoprotein-N-acetylgalactosamine 3-beta-galactosyltransferase 1 n=1 Tax=Nippostrongylus brasiliensis TaxID=27835 RepID=A0A0N4YNB9_NIPBR